MTSERSTRVRSSRPREADTARAAPAVVRTSAVINGACFGSDAAGTTLRQHTTRGSMLGTGTVQPTEGWSSLQSLGEYRDPHASNDPQSHALCRGRILEERGFVFRVLTAQYQTLADTGFHISDQRPSLVLQHVGAVARDLPDPRIHQQRCAALDSRLHVVVVHIER